MSLFDKEDEDFFNTYQKALDLLDYAPHTEKMLKDKLLRKKYKKEIIDDVIKKLNDNRILNDTAYAETLSINLVRVKLYGPLRVIQKLKLKGIEENDAVKITRDAFEKNNGELEIAKRYIQKNILSVKRLLDKNQIQKIKMKMYNNGFNFNIINKITENIEFYLE